MSNGNEAEQLDGPAEYPLGVVWTLLGFAGMLFLGAIFFTVDSVEAMHGRLLIPNGFYGPTDPNLERILSPALALLFAFGCGFFIWRACDYLWATRRTRRNQADP